MGRHPEVIGDNMFKKWFKKKDNLSDALEAEIDKMIDNGHSISTIIDGFGFRPITPAPSPQPVITSITATKPLYTSSMISGLSSGVHYPSTIGSIGGGGSAGYSHSFTVGTNLHNSASVVTFYKIGGGEIVRLNQDGTITWASDIDVDEAAEAFGRAVSLGAEMQTGITQGVKQRMRDSVFNDLINIAKEKGSLTAEDLTFLLEASKIVEKLRGGK